MTTNRMGLEQTLSDERLEEVANIGSVDQMAFPPSHAQCAAMARELLAYRKASKDPVAWTDDAGLELLNKKFYTGDICARRESNKDRSVPLYASPPLQAVTLPPEFHSEHGVIVQLEKVMAALAVHGIKYERRHQKVVGLRAGIDAIRAEGIDVDAEKINTEKYHK